MIKIESVIHVTCMYTINNNACLHSFAFSLFYYYNLLPVSFAVFLVYLLVHVAVVSVTTTTLLRLETQDWGLRTKVWVCLLCLVFGRLFRTY